MALPLREILNENGNKYEISKAVILRSNQFINNKAILPKESKDKIVPYAMKQVLSGEIKYSKA